MKSRFREIYRKLPVIRELQAIKAAAILQTLEALKAGDERYRDPTRLLVHGAQCWSQNFEDGMIAEIFRRIGTTSKTFLEIGVEDGTETNTTLLLSTGWTGWWIEANEKCCASIREQLKASPDIARLLTLDQAFVSPDNINNLLAKLGVPQEIDIFSLDIDLNTYHVWAAIFSDFRPRVILVEYNSAFPPDQEWVVPLRAGRVWDGSQSFGASLKSFEILGAKFGYSLVGCDILGINAFFVRNDLVANRFAPPFTSENHHEPPRYHLLFRFGHPPNFW